MAKGLVKVERDMHLSSVRIQCRIGAATSQDQPERAFLQLSDSRVPIPNQIGPCLETFARRMDAITSSWDLEIVRIIKVRWLKVLLNYSNQAVVWFPAWRANPVCLQVANV